MLDLKFIEVKTLEELHERLKKLEERWQALEDVILQVAISVDSAASDEEGRGPDHYCEALKAFGRHT